MIAVGRLVDRALATACADYAARIRRQITLEMHEIRSPAGRLTPSERRRIEGERILDAVPRGARTIALTRTGILEELARRLDSWRQQGRDLTLLVGGAYGLDSRVLECCDFKLSLSKLQFPHELARLILLEQLYRALSILSGSPYHKADTSWSSA